jgi:hypothetical protein
MYILKKKKKKHWIKKHTLDKNCILKKIFCTKKKHTVNIRNIRKQINQSIRKE